MTIKKLCISYNLSKIIFLATFCFLLSLLNFASDSNDDIVNDDKDIYNLIHEAYQYFSHENYDSAIIYYSKAALLTEKKMLWDEFLVSNEYISRSNLAMGILDTALYFARESEDLLVSEKVVDSRKSVEIDYLLGQILGKRGEVELSEKFYLKAIIKCGEIKYDSLEAVVNKAIGNVNLSKGNYDKALDYYQKALNIENSRVNASELLKASLFQNIGIVYSLKGEYVPAGDFFEKSMIIKEELLEKDDPQLANVYINFGRFQTVLGKNQDALMYLDKAESIFLTKYGSDYPGLASIFFNKGSIYLINNDYEKALSYHEKAIVLYSEIRKPDDYIFGSLYMNIGIIYENYNQFDKAIEYYKKSLETNMQPDSYVRTQNNLGSCYFKMEDYDSAENSYLLSINESVKYFGQNSSITANFYLNYGVFCDELGKPDEAYHYLQKAYSIYNQSKGLSEYLLANALQHLGNHYSNGNNYALALEYYQLSLISHIENFSKENIYDNPEIPRLNTDVNLYNTLQAKSTTFYDYYKNETKDIKDLTAAYETCILSIKLIESIKSSFGEENSKLILTSRVNDLYNLAVISAVELFNLTGNYSYLNASFEFSEKSKGAVLLSSLRQLEAIQIGNIPEEIRNEESTLKNALAFYKKLILDETQKETPDSIKLVIWKNGLFAKSFKYDSLIAAIETNYPEYYNLKYSNTTVKIKDIQEHLSINDLLIEYRVTDSILITYCISKDTVYLLKSILDNNFADKVEMFVNHLNTFPEVSNISVVFSDFAKNSNDLYKLLIDPIWNIGCYSRLIIVPDDILGYMTFEALVQKEYKDKKANYHNLDYLIKDYTISYANSATILLNKAQHKKRPGKLLAMAPNYENIDRKVENSAIKIRDLSQYLNPLEYTLDEVKNIIAIYDGSLLIEEDATEANFKKEASEFGILHFAMHTIIDDVDPLASKLVFSMNDDTIEDGFLNTYEIYNLDLNAELAVLSACKTGFGKLSKGEGVMSLARGFLYAGVPGIVMTLWEVEDISSAMIMEDFYQYLKDGSSKDEALRKAKLFYLESANQLNSHPYFWAAYVQIGDNSPVSLSRSNKILYFALVFLIILGGIGYIFLNRRKRKKTI